MPTVARFNLTPVKSTALHHPEHIELSERGTAGDRLFMFIPYRQRERELVFGVYAGVARPGTIRVGDPVTVLDA